MKRLCIILSFFIAINACKNDNPSMSKNSNSKFADFLENYYNERMKMYPLESTTNGETAYNDLLPNENDEKYRNELIAFYDKYKQELKKIDTTSLNENDRMSYEILRWELDINRQEFDFPTQLIPINQFDCMTIIFPQLGSGEGNQPFKTVKDYDNFLSRVNGFTTWMDSAIANMRQGIKENVVLPKSLVLKIIPQLDDIANKKDSTSIFWQPISKMPSDFSNGDKNRLKTAYQKAINEQINPAYKRAKDFLQQEYLAKARISSGVGTLPFGKDYYNYLIKYFTTTNISADEIFELGQKEVTRIRAEMEKVKNEVGFKGDLNAFFKYVQEDKKFFPYNKPEEVLDGYRKIHVQMEPQLQKLFDLKPKCSFEIKRTEAFRENSASAEYVQGSADGTRPGIFYTPVPDASKYNCFQDEALFLHEAIPGHHYQCMLQAENTDLPKFRRYLWYSAYGEGWALYTESLGKELGLYTDPYQYFGKLGMEMHRAIRLVVDAGMHAKGWTREQAIKYSLENESESEANTIAEVERYMAIPGQALSYKVGQLKIMELRQKAEKILGSKFDIRQFHNEVLKYGCVPIAVLENNINRWIDTKK